MSRRPRIIIVGGGFGGLWAARALAQTDADVYLLDKNNYHAFLPLLYQVAAAEIEPEQVAYPVRSILRQLRSVRFVMTEVTGFDLTQRTVYTTRQSYPYDYLILATGSRAHFFGVPGAEEHAFPLKTIQQAVSLRHRILHNFEQAAYETDPARRQQLLTFVIVGGGATGVEYAGALRELIDRPLMRDFPSIQPSQVQVILLEGADQLLPGMNPRLREYAHHRLEKMGVQVRTRALVGQVTDQAVILRDGSQIPTQSVVWTAGVWGDLPADSAGLDTAANGRVKVEAGLNVPGYPQVYVIGDLAYLEQDGRPIPMLAPAAIQQGEWAAANIRRQLSGQPTEPFVYRDKGVMATVGRNAAVAEVGGYPFTGFVAWWLWVVIHLYNLIGFRNRLVVLINWAWDYFFFERVARLILATEQSPVREAV